MLTPLSEAETAEAEIVTLGQRSLTLWPAIIEQLKRPTGFQQSGSIILAHPEDRADLENFRSHVTRLPHHQNQLYNINHTQLAEIQPDLAERFNDGIFVQQEAWLTPPLLLRALAADTQTRNVQWQPECIVEKVLPGAVTANNQRWQFNWVIDCRGLGAKKDIPQLRGVRGEIILLHAPEVKIKHLVRLMHPATASTWYPAKTTTT